MKCSKLGALLGAMMAMALTSDAGAFTHVVQQGETLASIAEKFYGRIQYEKMLVAANALEAQGGSPIVPGMALEVPAVTHRRVRGGETWADLAEELLGSKTRSDVLALANGSSPWLTPSDGLEILVPYNLRVISGPPDSIVTIAYRYMGDMNKAWILDHYNGLKGRRLQPGDAVLVPLTDLPLTKQGKAAAARAATALRSQSAGETRAVQLNVEKELPALIADVRGGRYVDAVTRGNRFLAVGALTTPQLALIHQQLLEAYVALEAHGRATEACTNWRKHDAGATLEPVMTSPKIIEACQQGAQ